MRLEEMRDAFPEMPEEIKVMVREKVEEELSKNAKKKKVKPGRLAAAILAATLALGTTAFAAVKISHLYMEKKGNYGVVTKIETTGETETVGKGQSGTMEIPPVTMKMEYLPEGMVETAAGKYDDAEGKPGISLFFYRMNEGDDAFQVENNQVVSNEAFQAGIYEGVYLEYQSAGGGDWMNQRIYVFYPDVHYVLEMYIDAGISKEEAIKTAQGISLTPVGSMEESNIREFMGDWSTANTGKEEGLGLESSSLAVSAEKMKNTHGTGDTFSLSWSDGETDFYPGLTATVTDVQVLDSVEILKESLLNESWQKEITADKKLLPKEIRYVKFGDGISTLDEIVESRKVPQKLIYITVEYGNEASETLTDVTYYGSLMRIAENGDTFSIYDRKGERTDCDAAFIEGLAGSGEMWYWDVSDDAEGKNHIDSLEPGETCTVHMAYPVVEEDLPYLYLNLNSYGGAYEFDDTSLEIGYVDIRGSYMP